MYDTFDYLLLIKEIYSTDFTWARNWLHNFGRCNCQDECRSKKIFKIRFFYRFIVLHVFCLSSAEKYVVVQVLKRKKNKNPFHLVIKRKYKVKDKREKKKMLKKKRIVPSAATKNQSSASTLPAVSLSSLQKPRIDDTLVDFSIDGADDVKRLIDF